MNSSARLEFNAASPEIIWASKNVPARSNLRLGNLDKAILEGVKATFVTLGTMFTGLMISALCDSTRPKDALLLTYGISATMGMGVTAKSIYKYNQANSALSDQTSQKKPAAPQSFMNNENFKVLSATIGKGWEVSAVCIGLGISSLLLLHSYTSYRPGESTVLSALFAVSALAGLGTAAKNYYYFPWNENNPPNKAEGVANLGKKNKNINLKDPVIEEVKKNSNDVSIDVNVQIPNFTTSHMALLSKLAKSLGLGWANFCCASITSAIAVNVLGIRGPELGGCVLGGSAVYGITSAINNFKNKEQTPSPSIKKSTLSKITSSTIVGLQAAAATVGASIVIIRLVEHISGTWYPSSSLDFPILSALTLAGGIGFIKTYNPDIKLTNFSSFQTHASSTPTKTKDSELRPLNSETFTLSNLARSLGTGLTSYGACISTSVLVLGGMLGLQSHIGADTILGWSVFYGAISAIRNFQNKKINLISTHNKSTLAQLATATYAGLHRSAATAGLLFTAGELMHITPTYWVGYSLIAASILAGGRSFIKAKPDLQLKRKWKETSKIKKSGLFSASLIGAMGLATLILGPVAMVKKLEDIRDAGMSTANDCYTAAQNQFTNTVYTKKTETITLTHKVKTQTTTKTLAEWISSFTDEEEAQRLIDLGKLPEDEFFCADILNTCDLDPTDTGHKKAYRAKMLKFHPDTIKYSKLPLSLAEGATAVLSKLDKKFKECIGKGESACEVREQEITIRHELIKPSPRAASILNALPECYLYPEEGDRVAISENSCASLDCTNPGTLDCSEVGVDTFLERELLTPHWLYAKITNAESECHLTHPNGTRVKVALDSCLL